jgi:HK97 family phage major capsid protein
MRAVRDLIGLLLVALCSIVPTRAALPRVIRHNLHPLMKRCYGKVVAGGDSGGSFSLPAAASVAYVAILVVGVTAFALHAAPPPDAMQAMALAAGSTKLVELRNKLDEKRKSLADVWAAAGAENDFNRKEVLDLLGVKDSAAAVAKVRELDKEINAIFDEAKPLAELEAIRGRSEELGVVMNTPKHADPSEPKGPMMIGDAIVAAPEFQAQGKQGWRRAMVGFEVAGFGLREIKATLFETGAGWAPESTRTGKLVEAVTRPIQVLDIIPSGRTGQAAVVYMEETTRTHSAAERSEGAVYAESAFVLTERSETVRSIGDSIPVTDEQLEDVEGAQSYLNNRLTFALRQRLDRQVLIGDGTAPNLSGITDRSGIQTQAKGADPTPDAIHKALTKVRVTGRAFPNFIVLHPNDWEAIRLLTTADGIYIWGSPAQSGPMTIWGLPVVVSDALTENTGLVGDFNFCQLFERRGIDVQVGYVGDQFKEGKRTIRADLRAAFAVYRAAAFATVTGI